MAAPGFLHSLAIHQMLHPPGGMAGALRAPSLGRVPAAAMAANPSQDTGLAGFMDRPLGQIGMALLAGGAGPLSGAASMLMQQAMMQRLYGARSGPQLEHLGNQLGFVDPSTGQFTPTYTEPTQPTDFDRMLGEAGIDAKSPEGQALVKQHVQNIADPVVNIPLPGGGVYMGPRSQMQSTLQGGQSAATPTSPPGSLAPPQALNAAVAQTESGNRDLNPDGSPVTSSAGAKFAMQVLPSTAHNPGYGVTPAANDTPAEYDRVGRDYLTALQKHYGGNLQDALAAYNAGPGTVDKALASGAPLPSQGYASKVAALMGAGSDIASQAQAAIAAGADPAAVRARAAQMGVTLP